MRLFAPARTHSREDVFRTGLCAMLAFGLAGCAADRPALKQAVRAADFKNVPQASDAPDETQDLARELDRIFSWVAPDSPGCAVAASKNGRKLVDRAYGLADLESGAAITPDTLFDIGSTHKQFVAAAILLLAKEKRLSLQDDIRTFIPELPDYPHTVRIDHLLTHTSGVRDWTGLLALSRTKTEALEAILRQRELNFPPGEEWSYSNSGYVLAKEIVARVSGMPFGDFARQRLFEPLGMTRTLYSVDMRDDVENKALAYERRGGAWRVSMRLDEDRGGGGVLSTTGDLLIWNEALANDRLGIADALHQQARLNNGRILGYARGLFVDLHNGEPVVWRHGGGSAGYRAWLGRLPKPGLSIAILCNSGDGTDQGLYARRIAERLAPGVLPPLPGSDQPAPSAGSDPFLTRRAGLFVSEDGDMVRLIVEDGRLEIAGGPPLKAEGGDVFRPLRAELFFRSQDAFDLQVLSPDAFELTSMEGAKTRYQRAEAYAPRPAALEAFAGRYQSEELDAVFDITPGPDSLIVRLEHLPERPLPFLPVYRDVFQFAQMTIRFERDADGRITALDYANPVLRRVRLTRLGGR